jgi:uncharacterized protein
MTEKNFDDYEIPQDLKFKTQDIIEMGGLRCTLKIDPARFADLYEPPNRITDAHITVEFFLGSDDILAQGHLDCRATLLCHRCLEEYSGPVKAEFEETFSTTSEIIDIMEKSRQALLLAAEIQQLCSGDCKGLCHSCGKNLNAGPCSCRQESASPFAALKDRLSDHEEDNKRSPDRKHGGKKI